ncbi:MAG: methyltransferase [Nanoarchaeota archaeon]|nr:methyltransferase [Nanoarchaeota archaeon]MBU1030551.1 methyltransferase [Nanoarchaeota archaeon]MBU1850542.1 methyltransferase [Nanoarchaeota archaeon]
MTHYYSEKQDSPLNLTKFFVKTKKASFDLYSGSGVFSKNKLDLGTDVLLNNLIMKNDWEVLDLGCGIGVVGIFIKKLFSNTKVTFVDINSRALKLTRMNLKLHNLTGKIIQSNIYEKVKEHFDTIIMNPPQTAGKNVCFEMVMGAKKHLKRNGVLQIVARHNKGGKVLSEKMFEVFGNVEEIAKKSGYRVYISKQE